MTDFEKASNDVNAEFEGSGLLDTENCIEWLRGSTVATVTLVQKKHQNRIRRYAEKYPDLFQIVSERGGVMLAHIPTRSIRIQYVTPTELSEEEKEAARERLELYRREAEERRLLEKEEAQEEDD